VSGGPEAHGDGWARLRPFQVTLEPPGDGELELSGHVEAGGYVLRATRGEQRLEVSLPARALLDAPQPVALVEPTRSSLGAGLHLQLVTERTADGGHVLAMRIETPSFAVDRGRRAFARLGAGPELARLVAPPRWAATLRFDADGHPLRR
jgi:hypothetical protein